MARSWLVDSKIIARKVKNATLSSSRQSRETGTGVYRECPKCKHQIDNSDVAVEWPGLPAGVKFDPSDLELIEHLAGKVELKNSNLHPLIDEFIPTLEEDEGICYTHPENLPGVKLDGSSIHFFHHTSKAYSTGCRKRRRIQRGDSLSEDHVRWHKTGKTRPVIENGIQKGCKKIMVLYKSSKKSKPDKTNWVMHQYHLGTEEDEKEGELVVSKVFYQQQSFQVERNNVKETETSERLHFEDLDLLANKVDPRTPKTQAPDPLRPHIIDPYDGDEDIEKLLCDQGTCLQLTQVRYSSTSVNEVVVTPWLAGESQVVEDPDPLDLDSSLLCHEVFDSFNIAQDKGLEQFQPYAHSDHTRNNTHGKDSNSFPGIPDLDSIYVDTPPDFNLSDLQFGSQESILDWIDWL